MSMPPPVARPGLADRALPGLRLRVGTLLALVLLLVAFVSIVWTPHPVDGVAASVANAHLLGTDPAGRDLLSMTMRAMLTSFVVAGVGLAIGLFLGVPLGFAAAGLGGWGGRLLLWPTGIVLGLSTLGIALILAAQFGASALNAMLAIGLGNAAMLARTSYGLLRLHRGRDDIAASRLAGVGRWDLLRRHVLPDLLPALGAASLGALAGGVLLEAALSFVGLAILPPGASLGLMLRDALGVMLIEPRQVLVPGGALFAIALAFNLTAVGLAERLPEGHDAA